MIQETSQLAFYNFVKPNLGERQKAVFELLEKADNLTNSEIASRLGWPINTVVPRVYELRKANLVCEATKRVCRITGRRVIAWQKVKNTLF